MIEPNRLINNKPIVFTALCKKTPVKDKKGHQVDNPQHLEVGKTYRMLSTNNEVILAFDGHINHGPFTREHLDKYFVYPEDVFPNESRHPFTVPILKQT